MTQFLGVDTGGTFTDFVLYDDGALRVHKVLSTPEAPERAILQGIQEMGLCTQGLIVVHGSTVATNAVLEGKGVRTVYITNRGLRDLLTIGRQARAELYDLQPRPLAPPVEEGLCLETGGRLGADGLPVEPLTEGDLARLRAELERLAPEAVAINLLFSYLDDSFERAIEAVVPDGIFVSHSSRILPEIREYERGIATWLNAWIGPLVERYLSRLRQGMHGARLSIMQSAGETVAADQASVEAVRMLLSGPAGGLVGARFMGRASGLHRLLTFDMGGTSTDVALLDGAPGLTHQGRIGRYPVAVPMVDMHTIGAGGGSIARVDAGGMLLVGPESAGASPGPACYGRGGEQATVTDANLVLGRLRADAFLGGTMPLDGEAAHRAVTRVAADLGCTVEEAALGIVRIADEHMAQALRLISVQRGEDPRHYTLVSFGGAGGLHVCALAEAMGMTHALMPRHAGVLSALGMIAARPGRQFSQSRIGILDVMDETGIEADFESLILRGREALMQEGIDEADLVPACSADLRYRGQSFSLNLPWQGSAHTVAEFHALHERRYGHRLATPVELVTLRVSLRGKGVEPHLPPLANGVPAQPKQWARLHGIATAVPVYDRDTLVRDQVLTGPTLVTERVGTLWIAPGWTAAVDGVGNIPLWRAEK